MKPSPSIAKLTRDVIVIAREIKGECAAGIKVGDKIIIEGANINLEKSDRVCGYALSNLMPAIFAVRMGVDLENFGLKGRLWQCVDPGPPYTLGGTVLFEIMPLDKNNN